MKRRRPTCFLPLLLIISACLGAAPALEAAKLKWDRTEVRLEMKPDQEQIKASFKVTNEGDKALRIAQVKTSCGCTGSVVDRRIIEPGESSEIVASFNKGKRQGKNHNKLQVFLDSRKEPVATLHMIVDIPELIGVQPPVVYWSSESTPSPREVRIDFDQRYINQLESLTYNESLLSIERAGDPSGKADLILTITPRSYEEPLRESVQLKASGPDGRVAEARVLIFVQP